MKTVIIFFAFWCILGLNSLSAQKTAVHWYLPTMSLTEAQGLNGYDLIIVDPEIVFNNREALNTLRRDNPQVKIYCYFNLVEWFNPMFNDKPWSKKIVACLDKKEAWFLHGQDGQRLSFWQGMQTMNCRSDCPRLPVYTDGKKLSYVEFMTDRFINDILKEYHFDGVLMDNLWNKIHWLGQYGSNQNGLDYGPNIAAGDSAALNALWQKGVNYCLDKLKAFGQSENFLIGNPGHLDYRQCGGKMFENFPEIYLNEADKTYEAWYENMNNAKAFSGPDIFNARKDNYFFTLCSSMLLDNIYFSYLQNTGYDHKYNLHLGRALGKSQSENGQHFRRYEQGIVFVDPKLKQARIAYSDGRERRE